MKIKNGMGILSRTQLKREWNKTMKPAHAKKNQLNQCARKRGR